MLKIKQVLLDSCSNKRMQAEHKYKALDQSLKPRTDSHPSYLIQITTGYEPNCCLCYAGTRKEKSCPNWEGLYLLGILDAK
jgi:hypothetical protein